MPTRNLERFPNDFMFQLNEAEFANLRLQFATSSLKGGSHGGLKNRRNSANPRYASHSV